MIKLTNETINQTNLECIKNFCLLDAKIMQKDSDFADLPETYIIFITENDVMKKGLPLYRIERCNLDTHEIFKDGAHILYVNGEYRESDPLGWLMHDFACPQADDMKYQILADRVKFLKEEKKEVEIMSGVMEKRIMQERQEEKRETARRMLTANKYNLEEIASISGLSLDKVKQL